MTFEQACERLRGTEWENRAKQHGDDLWIECSAAWVWTELQTIAELLETEQIDMSNRSAYDTISDIGPYEHLYGCDTCGYGSKLIVRGVLVAKDTAQDHARPDADRREE